MDDGTPAGPRAEALAQLRHFEARCLPAALRRLARWKGFDPVRCGDVVDDLRQELALDCVAHAEEVAALEPRARHARWFRLLQRHHYELWLRPARQDAGVESLDDLDREAPEVELDRADPAFRLELARVGAAAVHLKNGRLHTEATAARLGVTTHAFRNLWRELTARLGFDERFFALWRERLADALVAHAAALLRADGRLRLVDEAARPVTDPERSFRRLMRVRRALSGLPPVPDLKRILARFTGRGVAQPLSPPALLDSADELRPGDATVLLWRFEVAVLEGELARAARSVVEARRAGADPVRVVLARARLMEARAVPDAAGALLRRALRRAGSERRLRASLVALEGEASSAASG